MCGLIEDSPGEILFLGYPTPESTLKIKGYFLPEIVFGVREREEPNVFTGFCNDYNRVYGCL